FGLHYQRNLSENVLDKKPSRDCMHTRKSVLGFTTSEICLKIHGAAVIGLSLPSVVPRKWIFSHISLLVTPKTDFLLLSIRKYKKNWLQKSEFCTKFWIKFRQIISYLYA
ncbi:MAG: hypothetical protein II558_04670, partial [Treponema sp.]|nr:hypothetical protein [Treponema sp.]